MGALLYSNETYKETLPIIDASGLPSYLFSYATIKGWRFNWTDGAVAEAPSPADVYPRIEQDVERLFHFWENTFAPWVSIGYKVREVEHVPPNSVH